MDGNQQSGFTGIRFLLENPAVEAAVIELSGDWPLEFGHPCDGYDVLAVPNVQCTPIEIDGSPSSGQASQMMVELLTRARYAVVLNADDPGCVALLEQVAPGARLVLIASDAQNQTLVAHREGGGEALILARRPSGTWAIHAIGPTETPLMRLPIALTASNGSNETNTLIALAVAGVQGVSWATACAAMESFYQVPEALVA